LGIFHLCDRVFKFGDLVVRIGIMNTRSGFLRNPLNGILLLVGIRLLPELTPFRSPPNVSSLTWSSNPPLSHDLQIPCMIPAPLLFQTTRPHLRPRLCMSRPPPHPLPGMSRLISPSTQNLPLSPLSAHLRISSH
jgi:hypothetical protein